MKINKVINNNIVSAFGSDGKEVIVTGKGIGFIAKQGKRINKDKIDKIYKMDSQSSLERFSELLGNVPIEHFEVSNELIGYANKTLDNKLNKNIYITLTDHISFAIDRYEKGFEFSNPLLFSIKTLYKKEFDIGIHAIKIINERFGISFTDDEAAAIAMHFVNAQYNLQMHEAIDVTKLIKEAFKIIQDNLNLYIKKDTLACERFVTHLRFFAMRIIKKEKTPINDVEFKNLICKKYVDEFNCSKKIADYIIKEFDYQVQDEELLYLTVHIRRLSMESK
jgi:beta-glucoside operon transcriptional antiterminator